jgi:hypothetical protein
MENKVVTYQTEDGTIEINTHLENDTICLSQRHLFMKNIFWKILFFGIPLIVATGCQTSTPIEKIIFPTEEFNIRSTSDTTIFGEQGTRIFIGSQSFQLPNGDIVKDSIQIQLKEFYKKSDIILADLSTESDGKILETGGMLYIKAYANGEELSVRPDKRIVVHFPREKYSPKKMNLFYADSNTSTDSSVNNWDVDTINLVKRTLKLGSFGWWYPAVNDSTGYNFTPKDFADTGYYWNPLDFHVKSYIFSDETIREIERTKNINNYLHFESWNDYGVECDMYVSTKGYIHSPKITTKISYKAKQEILTFLESLPQLEPGKNKYDEIIQRRGLLFITPGNIVPLYQTDEQYLKSFDKKYSKFEKSPIKNVDAAELEFYIFSISKLGWINCDRFLKFEEKIDLMVNIDASPDLKLKLSFSEFDGFLKPTIIDGKYLFRQVPVGENSTLVGINTTDNELTVAIKEITISNQPIEELLFAKTTLGELRLKLESLK